MKNLKGVGLSFLLLCCFPIFSQNIIHSYQPQKEESLKVGKGEDDVMPYIQKGYTLMLPAKKPVQGVLIFLEGSEFDKKNRSAKLMYSQASEQSFAVLSVSTEIPLDFYFKEDSLESTHQIIQDVFSKYNLPNNNIFFLGASLVGHRGMQYIKFIKESDLEFQLNIQGIVLCNFTLDWTRKWHQHEREIRINKNDLGEATFINYMLETNFGTPETSPDNYHNLSPYSYYDQKNRNINLYSSYAILAIIEPDIEYRLSKYKTLYENNSTDIVGFIAEQRLAGNQNTELIILQPEDNTSQHKSSQATWDNLDKDEVMNWILKESAH